MIIDIIDGEYWWLLLMMIIDDCDKTNFSDKINEVIRSVLNFLFFLHDKISQVQKSTKKHKKALKSTKKYKNTTNLRFIDIRFIDIRFINLKFIKLKKHKKALKGTKKHNQFKIY